MPEPLSRSKQELLERLLRGGEIIAATKVQGIPPRPTVGDLPMSYGQEQLWVHSQFATELPIYNDPVTIYRYGNLDRVALERAFTEIVRRHESWRTTFCWKDGNLVQVVQPALAHIEIPFRDLSAESIETRDETSRRIALEDVYKPFDLTTGPTYRLKLVRFSESEHRFYLSLHHIVFDGLSLYRIFISELQTLYEAFVRGLPSPLVELPMQYGDYAAWQRGYVDKVAPAQIEYWRKKLAGAGRRDVLVTDHPRGDVLTYRGAMVKLTVDDATSKALKEVNQKLNITLFASLLATFYLTMWAQSGEDDLTIATTSAGRHRSELEGMMGYFLDTLVLRVSLAGDPTFAEFATQCKETLLEALANDVVPFSRLVKEFSTERDNSRHPFFQVMFSLEPPLAHLGPEWKFARMDIHNGTTKFDINLELDDTPHGIEGRLVYNVDLFERTSIENIVSNWHSIVTNVAVDPSRRISELVAGIAARRATEPASAEADAETSRLSNGFVRSVRRFFWKSKKSSFSLKK